LLLEAFDTFRNASSQLEKAYSELKTQAKKLDLELKETNAQLALALSEQEHTSLHLKSILNTLNTGIMVIDLDGKVIELNPASQKILGILHKTEHFEDMVLDQGILDFIRRCLKNTHARMPHEEITIEREGVEFTLELSFSLVRSEKGRILSVLILISDVTLFNRLKNQSNRNARLAAMGEVAAELAHEIRNPLGSIKLFASLLLQDIEDGDAKPELAEQIIKSVQTIDTTVSNMLTYSADVETVGIPVCVGDLLEECLPLFAMERQQKEIHFKLDVPGRPLWVKGDAHLLKQMILNLCLNAVKAMDSGGTFQITVSSRGDYVDLVIKDDGCGIPQKHLHKIFDPFYSTFQGGTGLGLSVVNQIVEKHHGAIDVQSETGKGTTVFVSLPIMMERFEEKK
jgi:PAS domain S-box-containing protein